MSKFDEVKDGDVIKVSNKELNRSPNWTIIFFSIIIILAAIVLPITLAPTPKPIAVIEPTVMSEAPKVMDGVVHLQFAKWQGSGFVVGPRLIVTARHCTEHQVHVIITTNDGHKLKATRMTSMRNHDVGFIYVDDLTCIKENCEKDGFVLGKHKVHLKALELGSIKDCKLGQEVFAIGSPYGKINFNNLTSGIISSLTNSWAEEAPGYGWEISWITTAVGHPGNSGCPIFTLDGKVRGILVGGISPVLILAMPCDLFIEDIKDVERMFILDNYRFEEPEDEYYDVYRG